MKICSSKTKHINVIVEMENATSSDHDSKKDSFPYIPNSQMKNYVMTTKKTP